MGKVNQTCSLQRLPGKDGIEPEQRTFVDVLETYVRYRPNSITPLRWSVKVGAFFSPISLENTEIGWTSYWTLTPYALNSWVGEELRTIGSEGQLDWRRDSGTIALTGAVFRDKSRREDAAAHEQLRRPGEQLLAIT